MWQVGLKGNMLWMVDSDGTLLDSPKDWVFFRKDTLTGTTYSLYSKDGKTLIEGEGKSFKNVPIADIEPLNSEFTAGDSASFEDWYSENVGFNAASGGNGASGWGAYVDTNYTEVSPLSLIGGAAYVNLTNNAGNTLETQLPTDVATFYDGTVITGRFGDGLNITLSFAVKPITNQVTRVTVVPDIGGAVGEISDYERDISFTRGQNITQRYLSSFDVYTYDTWEANGAQLKIKADQDCEIWNIRYLLTRTHKAR